MSIATVMNNRSMLFVAITNNQPYGFVVLQPMGNTIHVWAAWSSINDELLLQEAWQEIQAIAKQGSKTRSYFYISKTWLG
jgi:hypothetical protein